MAFFTSTLIAKYSDIFKQEWEEYLERSGTKNESDFVAFLRARGKTTTEAKKMLQMAIEQDVIEAPENRLSEFIAERNRTRKNPVSSVFWRRRSFGSLFWRLQQRWSSKGRRTFAARSVVIWSDCCR